MKIPVKVLAEFAAERNQARDGEPHQCERRSAVRNVLRIIGDVIQLEGVLCAARDHLVDTAVAGIEIHIERSLLSLIAIGIGPNLIASEGADQSVAIVERKGVIVIDGTPQQTE